MKPGLYVIGKVLSCTASVFNRKDGSGKFVVVRTEISTRPGMVTLERMYDPAKDTEIKVEGDKVTVFPTYPEDVLVMFRVEPEGIRENKGKVRITKAEKVA